MQMSHRQTRSGKFLDLRVSNTVIIFKIFQLKLHHSIVRLEIRDGTGILKGRGQLYVYFRFWIRAGV